MTKKRDLLYIIVFLIPGYDALLHTASHFGWTEILIPVIAFPYHPVWAITYGIVFICALTLWLYDLKNRS